MKEEILIAQIKILSELEYRSAYTGSLNDLKLSSYVLYSDITSKMNELRIELNKLRYGRKRQIRDNKFNPH